MARNFDDFISAYCDYAQNQYAPENFTLWTGISVIAATLQRRVWTAERNDRNVPFFNYPNLFVLLTAAPGIGKSSAIGQGVPLLNALKETHNNKFLMMKGVTTAKGLRDHLITDTLPDGRKFTPVFCVASEGSDSPLKNHGDDFRSAACKLYDCEEDSYEFTTGTSGKLKFPLPVMNMLIGVTFDFLGSVVDQNSVFGGLASRMTYVIEKNTAIKGDFYGNIDITGEVDSEVTRETGDPRIKTQLVQDLIEMHKLYGGLTHDRNAIPVLAEWYEDFKKDFNNMESERMRSLLIRQRTLLKKLLIIIAISEGKGLAITKTHAEKAVKLVKDVTKDNPYILSQSATANVDTQKGTTQYIAQTLKKHGGKMNKNALRSATLAKGNSIDMLTKTFDYLRDTGWIKVDGEGTVHLLVDPDRYL